VSFAIIRGRNGRRHEVDFGDAAIEVDVAVGSETVQITVEAIHDQVPPDKRRFATMAIPREKLAAALGADLRDGMGEGNPTAPGWSPATIDIIKFGVAMAIAEGK
jgi:hypothetical protein